MKTLVVFAVSLLISTSAGFGHEFWIQPDKYQTILGEPLVAKLVGGQKFSGSQFSFVPKKFERFDLVHDGQIVPVEGRIGDRPALQMDVKKTGLWIIVHETTDTRLTYQDWDTFEGFVVHKNLGDTLVQHVERGLPENGFQESYRRFVKALVAVGDGIGQDERIGLQTEIVALTNPYTDDISAGLPVEVLYRGEPRRNVQLEVFDRSPEGQVTVTTQMTDSDGQAIVAVIPGHEYLLDAVVMLAQQPTDAAPKIVWRSLWAALTFSVPQQ